MITERARRRRSIGLGLSAVTLTAALASCDKPDPPKVYSSVQQCQTDHPAKACADAWQASVGEHQTSAPKYGDKAQCEAQYGVGHCETYQSDHGSVFMPMLAGFMIGRMMSNNQNQYGYGGYFGRPVFFAPGGGYAAPAARPGEAFFGRGGGFTSRGGFGATAGLRGGFGGG